VQKKTQDFSQEDIIRFAQSPAGQQLIAMLRQGDSGRLQQAISQAQAGNYTGASQILNDMLSSAQAQKLLKELGG